MLTKVRWVVLRAMRVGYIIRGLPGAGTAEMASSHVVFGLGAQLRQLNRTHSHGLPM